MLKIDSNKAAIYRKSFVTINDFIWKMVLLGTVSKIFLVLNNMSQ